jgi:hypothetical protein
VGVGLSAPFCVGLDDGVGWDTVVAVAFARGVIAVMAPGLESAVVLGLT